MKDFWKSAFGAFVGSFAAIAIFSVLTVIFVLIGIAGIIASSGSITSSSQEPKQIKSNSVLLLDLTGTIVERSTDDEDMKMIMSTVKGIEEPTTYDLQELIDAVKAAKEDKNIEGIYLKCGGIAAGSATAYRFHQALESFKESGKWIYAYAPDGGYGTFDYYFASLADSVFINREGEIDIHGFMAAIPYYKTLMDKVGVQAQIFKVGTYKSAVEPYMLTSMSEANREQTELYIGNMWKTIATEIAEARNMDFQQINADADSVLMFTPTDELLRKGYVSDTCYGFEVADKVKARLGIKKDEDINYVSVSQMNASVKAPKTDKKNKIAVLYAVGEIGKGEGIDQTEIIPYITDATKDDDIKGLVLRVNSRGGSAYDSEQIWAALEQFKAAGKPFAVSMGDYAASGGYYISSGADYIFAEPTTLTGSIGIYGMIPCFKGVTDKIGVNINFVTTNKNSVFSILEPLNTFQSARMQSMVNRGYELFTTRCAEGRDMALDSIKMIAEGRVWDGTEALKLGLVDSLGSLEDALAWVAEEASVPTNYEKVVLPEPEDFYTRLMKQYKKYMIIKVLDLPLDETFDYRNTLKKIITRDPIQARYDVEITF